jgi:hypothetical protein
MDEGMVGLCVLPHGRELNRLRIFLIDIDEP